MACHRLPLPPRPLACLAAAQKPCLLLGGMCCSIVHHKRSFPYGSIYTHHFAVLEAAAGPGSLRLAWLSEGFRCAGGSNQGQWGQQSGPQWTRQLP